MKKSLIFSLIILLLVSCKNNDEDENENVDCHNLTTIADWTKVNFKTNYTIQVPTGYVGGGMQGFEGNTFSKSSTDNKIQLNSGYCNSLFCFDFGDTLRNPIPQSIQVTNNSSDLVTLNKIETFCQNSEVIGYLFYSNNDISRGRLYWKDENAFKEALEIDFYLSELETVKNIIETIKRK